MKQLRILIVDDDPADVALLQDYFEDATFQPAFEAAGDGEQALARLRKGKRPDVVLLDLNMPRMDGIATLKAIRDDPKLADLPVIVLTTSGRESDIMDTFEHRATYFITKPDDPDGFDRLIALVEDFARTYIWK